MSDLTIRVGDLTFTAAWEEGAPLTRAVLEPWLPISSRLIHCRWSGESTWIPFGDRAARGRVREPHLAPRTR